MDVLKGIRVLEVAEWGFVPSAGTVLADWGAELIKIEHPVRGDPIRGLVNAGVIPGARGVNFFVEHLGRNKRSVGIDFNQPAGRDLLYRLVEQCDVFLTNFLPPARERLGITYADLRKLKGDLIYAKGHGQGQRGPDADRGGYDGLSFWARGGIGDRITPSGMPLLQQRAAFGDFTGGMFIAGGIAAALFHRERTGEGLEVDVSLLGNAVWVLAPDIVAAMAYGFELPRAGEMPGVPNALVNTYPCADGRQLVLMMLQHDRYWPIFCKAVRREDWLADPRFNPDPVRAQNQADLVAELKAMFAGQPRGHWAALLNESECIWGPVQSPLEVVEDRQVVANHYILDVERAGAESVRVSASPVQFNGEPPEVRNGAPDVGADTEAVLLEMGCTWEDLAGWKEAGIIS
ncbi:MAG TPA: CoA transferase [Candidatus Bathyarchaeia archaeon]|nr:CoA transferase [Candidatus Bathyarchaeia archaeon]